MDNVEKLRAVLNVNNPLSTVVDQTVSELLDLLRSRNPDITDVVRDRLRAAVLSVVDTDRLSSMLVAAQLEWLTDSEIDALYRYNITDEARGINSKIPKIVAQSILPWQLETSNKLEEVLNDMGDLLGD